MKHTELPANEIKRLEELWRYSLHDKQDDPALDAITQLVASSFNVPIVLVPFVDQESQWFKSRFGLSEIQTPRNISFCAHAILEEESILEIRDTHQDSRFCENPLVTGPPYVRYYAGAALITPDGLKLGTLCIIDSQPRDLNKGETVARMSGDEFGLILIHSPHLLDRLDRLLSDIVTVQSLPTGNLLTITGSMGVTFYPDDNADPGTLLRHADQAMYRAKEEGGNRYIIFNTDHEQELKSAQRLRKDIAHGLQHDEFVLELQPQVDAKTLELVGVEALIRWHHPGGRRMPDDFLPYIVNSILEHDIDEWVVMQAFKLLDQWRLEAPELTLSINLTPQTLANKTLIAMLDNALRYYPDVDMNRLHVEVLESAATEELNIATDVMKACQARGTG